MFSINKSVRRTVAAIAGGLTLALAGSAWAQDAQVSAEAAYQNMRDTVGAVPGFAQMYPKAGIGGAWVLTRDMLFQDTALDLKTKALISLAVAAQIPCHYCVWTDTRDAMRAGATEEEIHEAVAVAALTRHWSTIFNGYQIDFETYKQEMGGE